MTRDQNDDLLEWVDYHRSIGVTNIILFDHNGTVPVVNDVLEHVKSGFIISYTYFSYQPKYGRMNNSQLYVYHRCIDTYRNYFDHIGFIDTDEFIVIKNHSLNIIDILTEYKDYGGLTLNWMVIGSNGHIKRPSGGTLRNYNRCGKNKHIKTIVNTKYVTSPSGDPHSFNYMKKRFAVDTNKNRVVGSFNAVHDSLYQVAYINHYYMRSFEDFQKKRLRGPGDGMPPLPLGAHADWDSKLDRNCDYLRPRNFSGSRRGY